MESGRAVNAHARAVWILVLTIDPDHTHARMALIRGFCCRCCSMVLARIRLASCFSAFELCRALCVS